MRPGAVLGGAFAVAALTALAACGEDGPSSAPTSGDAVKQRAVEAQTAQRRTGAEIQDRALNRVVRAVYLCENGERLSVDFDNPREMATVRNAQGEAQDLFEVRASDGIWYRSSGYELRGRGVEAIWVADGLQPTTCRAID